MPLFFTKSKRKLVLKHKSLKGEKEVEKFYLTKFLDQSHDLKDKNNVWKLKRGVKVALWLVKKFSEEKREEELCFIDKDYRKEVKNLIKETKKEKKLVCSWRLEKKTHKLKPQHKKFLLGL